LVVYDEGIYAECEAAASERVVAWQLQKDREESQGLMDDVYFDGQLAMILDAARTWRWCDGY